MNFNCYPPSPLPLFILFHFLPPVSALSLCVLLSPACSVCASCLFVLRPGRLGCLGNVCLEMSLPHAANSNSNKSNNNSSKGLQRPTQYVSAFNPGLPAATAGHRKGKGKESVEGAAHSTCGNLGAQAGRPQFGKGKPK